MGNIKSGILKRRYKIKEVDLGFTFVHWDGEPTGYFTFCIFINYGCLGWGIIRKKDYPLLYEYFHYKKDAEIALHELIKEDREFIKRPKLRYPVNNKNEEK